MKKTLVLFLAMMAVFAFGVCAIELDTAENAAEAVAENAVLAEDEVLIEDEETAEPAVLKPGFNIWTGTADPYTFDDETLEGFTVGKSLIDTYPEVVTKEITEGDGNKALEFGARFEHIMYNNFPVIGDRPLRVKLDVFYTGQVRAVADNELGAEMYNVTENVEGEAERYEKADIMVIYGKTDSTWTACSYDVKKSQTNSAGTGDYYAAPWEGSEIENYIIYLYSRTGSNEYISSPTYIDNVSIIPYYQISYDLNGGTGIDTPASSYFYVEPGYPYESIADGSSLTKDGKAFAGWALTPDATPNDVIDKLYPVPGSDPVLYAIYGEAEKAVVKPGLNIFTGTTKALTFEGNEKYLSKYLTTGAEVRPMAHGDDADNHMLWFNAGHKYIAVRNFPETEADRPFKLDIDVYYDGQVRIMDIDVFNGDLQNTACVFVDYESTSSKWYSFKNYEIKGTQTDSKKNAGFYTSDYYGDPFKNLYVFAYNSDTGVDNISVIPYYKLTYDLNGGEGTQPDSVYFYLENGTAYTSIADGSALTKDGQPFAGWAFSPDATPDEIVYKVYPKLGSDVTLYAVYGEASTPKYKPGINIWTGTEAPYTFEGREADEILSTFDTNDIKIVNYPEDSDNTAMNIVKMYGYMGKKNFPAIEAERPVELKYNVLSYKGQVRFAAISDVAAAKENADVVTTLKAGNWSYAANASKITACCIINQGTSSTTPSYNEAYHGKPFANLYLYGYSGTMDAYVDDIAVIPHYKITYDANGGTGSAQAAEYFYVASDKTYTLKNTSNDLVKGDLEFYGWALTPDATVNDVVTKVTPTLGEDVTVYAVYAKPITVTLMKDGAEYTKYDTVAGKTITVNGNYFADADNYYVNWQTEDGKAVIANQYTFNESATLNAVKYARKMTIGENAFSNGDFEENYIEVRPSAGNLFIVEDDEEHGNVLKYQRINSSYGSVQRGVIWETNRKYRIEWDAKLPTVVDNQYNRVYGQAPRDHAASGTTAIANEWVHTGIDYLHTADVEPQTDDVFTLYINPLPAGVDNIVYYDNIKLIPYHKVTFNANGAEGTAPEVDFTLDATYTITADAGKLTKDGYYFAGWATTADGEAVESVDTVVGKDIELFAVWAPDSDENAPASNAAPYSLRTGTTAGMRFTASVTTAQRATASEYGFVVAREDVLTSLGYDAAELTLNLSYNGAGEGKLFVKGVAYNTADGTDIISGEADNGDKLFTAVCTGIDSTDKAQVTTKITVRPYIVTNGIYAYGKPMTMSLYEIAKDIDTTELPADVVSYIETIIATAEA